MLLSFSEVLSICAFQFWDYFQYIPVVNNCYYKHNFYLALVLRMGLLLCTDGYFLVTLQFATIDVKQV